MLGKVFRRVGLCKDCARSCASIVAHPPWLPPKTALARGRAQRLCKECSSKCTNKICIYRTVINISCTHHIFRCSLRFADLHEFPLTSLCSPRRSTTFQHRPRLSFAFHVLTLAESALRQVRPRFRAGTSTPPDSEARCLLRARRLPRMLPSSVLV